MGQDCRALDMAAVEIFGGITLISLRGRLDTEGAAEIDLRFSAMAGAKRAIVVDLTCVETITALGLRLLISGARTVTNKGGRMVVLAPDDIVASALRTVDGAALIPIFHDRDAACLSMSRQGAPSQ